MKTPFTQEILEIIAPILHDGDFERLKEHRQHLFFTRYEHLLHTAWLAHRFAKFLGAHIETCVLAGLLHDYHHTRIKGYQHGVIAADNAARFDVSDEVLAMVRAHMFPLGFGKVPTPWTRNFLVLKAADFSAATVELVTGFVSLSWKHSRIRFRKTHSVLAITSELCSLS